MKKGESVVATHWRYPRQRNAHPAPAPWRRNVYRRVSGIVLHDRTRAFSASVVTSGVGEVPGAWQPGASRAIQDASPRFMDNIFVLSVV
ncbi:unnamed protein product, partial [Brenthis ino]